MRDKFVLIFLSTLFCAMAAFVVITVDRSAAPAYAEGSGVGADNMIVVTGMINNNQKDLLYVVDTERKTVGVYEFNGTAIQLKSVRHVGKDLQLLEYPGGGTQKPSVKEINDLLKTGEEKPKGK